MRLAYRLGSLFMVALLLLLVGCSSPTKSPESAKQPEPAKSPPSSQTPVEKIKVKVGGTAMNSLKHYPAIVANQSEISKLTGVEIEFTELKSTGETRKEMQLGNLDFGFIISSDLMLDSASDIQIVSVLTTSPLEALIVNAKNKNEIKSVKDLVGKAVGVSAIGSATHLMLNSILQLNGIDPKDVKVMPIGANVEKPFAENQVVAALTFEPFVFMMVETGKAVVLQDVRYSKDIKAIFGENGIPWTILAVRKQFAQKNPDVVNRLRAAIQTAAKKMNSVTPEEVIRLLPGDMQTAENLALYKANSSSFPADTTPKKNELDSIVNNLKSIKAISSTYATAPDVIYAP